MVAVTSVIAFLLVHMSGDPAAAMAGEGASANDIAAVRELFGFDRPLILQYLDWIGRLLQGDFGRSYYLRMDVVDVLAAHVPVTATLGVLALTFALALSIPLGVLAALRPNTVIDRISLWLAVAGQALPSFLFALGLMYLFGVYLRWLPISGDRPGALDHAVGGAGLSRHAGDHAPDPPGTPDVTQAGPRADRPAPMD